MTSSVRAAGPPGQAGRGMKILLCPVVLRGRRQAGLRRALRACGAFGVGAGAGGVFERAMRGGRDAADVVHVLESDALAVGSAIAGTALAAAPVTRRALWAVFGGSWGKEQETKRRQETCEPSDQSAISATIRSAVARTEPSERSMRPADSNAATSACTRRYCRPRARARAETDTSGWPWR